MAELPSVDSEIEARGYVAYPRESLVLPVADRLEALGSAYFGLGLPYLATFAFTACAILLSFTPYAGGGIIDTVLAVAFYSIPFLAAILSYVPMRRLALGTGRRAGAAVAYCAAIAVYITTVYLAWPVYTDQPEGGMFFTMLEIAVVAMTVFPLARILIALQMRKLGFRTGLWPSKKRLEEEVARLREENGSTTIAAR